MNIFELHTDPVTCAKMHVDKHVVKMPTEYAQMLSTAHRLLDGQMYEGRTKTGRGQNAGYYPMIVNKDYSYPVM